MTDILKTLSLARTALTDPFGLPDEEFPGALVEDRLPYAVSRIDDAMHMLDLEAEPHKALETVMQIIASVEWNLHATEHEALGNLAGDALDKVAEIADYLSEYPDALA